MRLLQSQDALGIRRAWARHSVRTGIALMLPAVT